MRSSGAWRPTIVVSRRTAVWLDGMRGAKRLGAPCEPAKNRWRDETSTCPPAAPFGKSASLALQTDGEAGLGRNHGHR